MSDKKVRCEICDRVGDWTTQQSIKIGCHYGSENDGLMFESEKVCPSCVDKVVETLTSINPKLTFQYYI